ncbi:hypothetical protein GTQ99_23885, partial [Kineococcus sp. T13]|uniref:hypothetical protein n=1 Tax=Kineococcus vitellinus TaxID=2696565 RepID=UPI00141220BD
MPAAAPAVGERSTGREELQAALAALDATAVKPRDASFVAAALAAGAHEWTAPVARRCWGLLTGPYRAELQAAGRDPD